jgi:hypothetical protein
VFDIPQLVEFLYTFAFLFVARSVNTFSQRDPHLLDPLFNCRTVSVYQEIVHKMLNENPGHTFVWGDTVTVLCTSVILPLANCGTSDVWKLTDTVAVICAAACSELSADQETSTALPCNAFTSYAVEPDVNAVGEPVQYVMLITGKPSENWNISLKSCRHAAAQRPAASG